MALTSGLKIYPESFKWLSRGDWVALKRRYIHLPYRFFVPGLRSYFSYRLSMIFWCFSQYRPSVRFGQPGKEQGRLGFLGTAATSFRA